LTIIWTGQFKKDNKKLVKQGKDLQKLKSIITKLYNDEQLPPKNKDHKLQGRLRQYRECCIEPDWLLIYQIKQKEKKLILVRSDSHSELFK
jgi:mRNA interferase YafQ